MMSEEFVFNLSTDLNYQDSTGDCFTRELLLKAPIGKHEKSVCDLQQMLSKAMLSAQSLINKAKVNNDTPESENDIDLTVEEKSEFILTCLRASDISFYDYKYCLYKMITNDLCFIRAKEKDIRVTMTLINDLSLNDKDKLVGDYSANFIMP